MKIQFTIFIRIVCAYFLAFHFSSCKQTNQDSRVKLRFLISNGITEAEYEVSTSKVSFHRYSTLDGKTHSKSSRKISEAELEALVSSISSLNVEKWLKEYGSHDGVIRNPDGSTTELSSVTSWSLLLESDGHSFSSSGYGMFPSDKDFLIPDGPLPTKQFTELRDTFMNLFPDAR